MKDSGEATYVLGINKTRDRNKGILLINPQRYIEEILKRFCMENSKPDSRRFLRKDINVCRAKAVYISDDLSR